MMKKNINQKMISQIEFYRMNNLNIVIKNSPISRFIEKSNSFTENPKEKEERLNQLKEKIKKVDEDVLKRNAKNIVFSDGNINSKIMLIGEGPGQKEDEMGKPFVGDAGILLNKMLKSINIDRDKVYITNVVNYRPPNNRKPDPVFHNFPNFGGRVDLTLNFNLIPSEDNFSKLLFPSQFTFFILILVVISSFLSPTITCDFSESSFIT